MAGIHIVEQGESLFNIAAKYNFSNWKTIYYHPENRDFRDLRPNPNVIYPGDKLYIPERENREEHRATDQLHKFVSKSQKLLLRIVLKNGHGDPIAGCRYELDVAGKLFQGTTDASGMLEQPVEAATVDATLALLFDGSPQGQRVQWPLKIANLDPVEYLTGIQARLNNLAFEAGPVDGISGPRTIEAVKAFQRKYKLKVDGIPGPRTQAKLKEAYGC